MENTEPRGQMGLFREITGCGAENQEPSIFEKRERRTSKGDNKRVITQEEGGKKQAQRQF